MSSNPTYLGTVQDVQGATISIALDKDTISGLSFIDGHGYRIGQIGSLVRISVGFTDLFGIVSHVGAGAVPESATSNQPFGYRWLKVQLIGEGRRSGDFKRGISQYPTIGDEAHLVTEQDLIGIYGRPDNPTYVRIGTLASSESIPALVDLNKLIARHSAIVGTTGSGKSTTVASILSSVSDTSTYPSARILVLDIHGEYHSAFGDRATIFRVNADEKLGEKSLYIPYWALTFDELIKITPFNGVNDSERTALIEKIKSLKLASLKKLQREGVDEDTLTVDTPIPFSIHRLWYDLYRLVCSSHTAQSNGQSNETEAIELDKDGKLLLGDIQKVIAPKYKPITQGGANRVFLSASPLNIRKQLVAMESLLRDSRYDFLFRPGPWCPQPTLTDLDAQPNKDLDTLVQSWIGNSRPITILDLSGVPVSILIDLIGAVIRLLFDALFWARNLPVGGRDRPLLFVLEEAHSYLNVGDDGPASIAVRRVVKEGRKYGLSAMIVSQRPAEIDPTILSQCGTIVALRLANSTDRSHITNTVSDNLEGLFSMLPTLRTGEAIIVGEAVHLPLRVLVDAPSKSHRPDSHDPIVYDPEAKKGWNKLSESEDYVALVENWRSEKARLIVQQEVHYESSPGQLF